MWCESFMDIKINNYPVHVKLGYFDSERVLGQSILVSLILNLGKNHKGLNDEGTYPVIDYGKVFSLIDETLANQEIFFVETAILIMGNNIMEKWPFLVSAHVSIEKPIIPGGINKNSQVVLSHTFYSLDH